MVGSAVETENSSRAEMEMHKHIEAIISQNLRPFLDGTVFGGIVFSISGFSIARVETEDGMRESSSDLPGYGRVASIVDQQFYRRILTAGPWSCWIYKVSPFRLIPTIDAPGHLLHALPLTRIRMAPHGLQTNLCRISQSSYWLSIV